MCLPAQQLQLYFAHISAPSRAHLAASVPPQSKPGFSFSGESVGGGGEVLFVDPQVYPGFGMCRELMSTADQSQRLEVRNLLMERGHIPPGCADTPTTCTVQGLFSEGSWWKRVQTSPAGRGRMPELSEKQPGSLLCCFCPPLPVPGDSRDTLPPQTTGLWSCSHSGSH